MYRTILIPAGLTCVGLLTWLISPTVGPRPMIPTAVSPYADDVQIGDVVLPGMRSAGESIMAAWAVNDQAVDTRYFSRAAPVTTSKKMFASVYFDEYQANPDKRFTGSLQVVPAAASRSDEEVVPAKQHLAFIFDRQSGVVQIHSGGQWHNFADWIETKDGIL